MAFRSRNRTYPSLFRTPPAKQRKRWLTGKPVERPSGFYEAIKRLEALFPHYSLKRSKDDAMDFRVLSLALASELFHDFELEDWKPWDPFEEEEYEHKRGNPKTLLLLLADLETIKREHGGKLSDPQAIRKLCTDERFSREWAPHYGDSGEAGKKLQNWLAEARNPAINIYWSLWQTNDEERRWLMQWINKLVRPAP